jgi:hypothetical protein
MITSLTYEDLVTTVNGVTASRALVNVIIDQQIGQQISVRHNTSPVILVEAYIASRWTPLAKSCSIDVAPFAVQMM